MSADEFRAIGGYIFQAYFLPAICLFLAGLNLWNLFKDWFNERFQRREDKKESEVKSEEKELPCIIGKSKYNLEKERLERERKANEVFHSENLDREDLVEPKKETVFLRVQPDEETVHDQSVSVDEFQLLTDTLAKQTISDKEKIEVKETLQKMQDTNFFEQFASQVKGAEALAQSILNFNEEEQIPTSGQMDFSKFIRR